MSTISGTTPTFEAVSKRISVRASAAVIVRVGSGILVMNIIKNVQISRRFAAIA